MQKTCWHSNISICDLISVLNIDHFGCGFFERFRGKNCELGDARPLRFDDDLLSAAHLGAEEGFLEDGGKPVLSCWESGNAVISSVVGNTRL